LFILRYVDEYLEYARKHNWISLTAVLVMGFCEIACIVTLMILKKISQKNKRDARQSLLDSLAPSKE